MDFAEFIRRLTNRLQAELPGRNAQMKMSSMVRMREMLNFIQPEDAIRSSVLVLLYPVYHEIRFVLMLRPDYDGVHSGQISFPGGKYEDGDESLIYTALREASEEIGINPSHVQVLGQLTEMYIPPSNYVVTPVVGFMNSRPEFVPEPSEVARIIEIRLADLMDKKNIQKKKMKLRYGFSIRVPSFFIDGNIIWGATAMMLSEFREIVKEISG
jgi:8-oxo-dGTP pyrophosphatase MutT (NUDIX family)